MGKIRNYLEGLASDELPKRDLSKIESEMVPKDSILSSTAASKQYNSPLVFLLIVIGGVVCAEVISMIIINYFAPLSHIQEILLDAFIMIILAFPFIYYYAYRPLLTQYHRSQQAEDALRISHNELEYRIKERTKELKQALFSSQQRQAEVEALLKGARAVLEHKEFGTAAKTIFSACKELIGATAGYVALEEGDYNHAIYLDPGEHLCLVDPTLPMPIRGLRAEAYSSGTTVFNNNFPESEYIKYLPEGHSDLDNVLFSPLAIQHQVVGLLGLANKPGGFSQHDAEMATAFGEIVAIALMNSLADQQLRQARNELEERVIERTHELEEMNEALRAEVIERKWVESRLEQQNQILQLLNSASLSMTQSLNLETVMDIFLESLFSLVSFDCAYIVLVEDDQYLTIHNIECDEKWASCRNLAGKRFEANWSPIFQEMLATQDVIQIPDTSLQPDWRHICDIKNMRSWLGVPLIAGGNMIGFLGVEKETPKFFSKYHIRLIETFVSQAAVAIQNAWLYEQVRAGRERLQSLSRRLVEVQENERRFVANELHDEAGQALASLMVHLKLVENAADQADVVRSEIGEMAHTLECVQEELHRLAMSLHPASLDYLGLTAALRQHVEAVGEKHNLNVAFEAVELGDRLPENMESILYRIVQEALTNVVRHSKATNIDILLRDRGDMLVLVIEDNGIGFDKNAALEKKRLGLNSISERVEMLNGNLVIESVPGKGTTLVVEVPYVNTHIHR